MIDYLITWPGTLLGRLYIQNPRETFDWKIFFQPLYKEAWIAIAVFSLVIPVLITMIIYYRKNSLLNIYNNGKPNSIIFKINHSNFNNFNLLKQGKHQDNEPWNIVTCLVFTLRSLTRLGSQQQLNSDRKKVLAVSIMLSGMVLYWFWESCLTSYFILPTKDFPFHSLEEFYTNTNKKVSIKAL